MTCGESIFLRSTYSLLDAHAHMCDPVFDPDREAVLDRAQQNGIGAIIAVGEDLRDAHRNLELAAHYPILKAAAGLYPTHLDPNAAGEIADFIRENRKRLIAIGEVGLDYWAVQDASQQELQRAIFKMFITLSKESGLPLNIHSRSAGRHAIQLLLENNAQRVHLHAFDGKAGAALPAVEAGFFFSIPPSIVRSRQKQKLVKRLPLSCLLVESDSPVLGPVAAERNEPANISVSIEAIAHIKSISVAEVVQAVTENSERLYGVAAAALVDR
jgi:TatD DNase family protein